MILKDPAFCRSHAEEIYYPLETFPLQFTKVNFTVFLKTAVSMFLVYKQWRHWTIACIVSTANKPLVGTVMTIGDVTRDIAICAVSYINIYCSKLKCLKMGIYWYTWRHTRSVNCIRFSPDSFLWKNWILWLLIYNCIFSLSFHLTEKMWLYLKKSKKKQNLPKPHT